MLAGDQRRAILGIAQRLPQEILQLGCAWTYEKTQAQGNVQALGRAARLGKGRPHIRVGKEALGQELAIRLSVEGHLAQAPQIELQRHRSVAGQTDIGVATRMDEAQLDAIMLGIPAVQANFKVSVGGHQFLL